MRSNKSSSQGSFGTTLLLVLFIGLKLTGYIDWSWWWVVSPVWIPFALAVILFGTAKLIEPKKGE